MWKLQALVLLSIVFTARHDDVHIAPSVSAGTVSPAPRPRADAWGYLDRQWIGFHHTFVGRRPMATGCKPGCKPAPHSGKPQTEAIGRIPWLPHSPKRQRGDGLASKPVPSLTLGAMWKSSRRAVKTMDSSTLFCETQTQ